VQLEILEASAQELKEAYEYAILHQMRAEQALDLDAAYHYRDEADYFKAEFTQRMVTLIDAITNSSTTRRTDSGEQSGS
jgi:hypothetical protein